MFRKVKDLIKKEYYLVVDFIKKGGYIEVRHSNSIYLLLPSEVHDEMKRRFNLNLSKLEKSHVQTRCQLMAIDEGEFDIVYSFRKIPSMNRT